MIEFIVLTFALLMALLILFCVISLPLAAIWGIGHSVIIMYQQATNRIDKIYALCFPFFFVVPFIYYNYINDSVWQAVLSFFITYFVIAFAIGFIWGGRK
ncbi:hypothetical protein [Avibacterium paragallinarum]|uniref:Uncharacterized protein n=1 Tax=Avibacterium paragallinarum TaxID=728 RepID=A0AAE5TJU4_AVIPA|nr:hypothetical protein [Avibacterium paragallinarum]MEE3609037.1 hypothetical protein [Avibacterium paragallinarum]MEE3621288.1 hypothetical protein [Avibacterium paragallinarum]MEE3668554.1 hypothetical protein [Avibacterium paragallinarum]MEE3681243.1 hypothetical protein [Avibacterium paragallinarum]MEE4386213.1 hypothetical protein [Avibacterium paragallinarum]